MPTLRHLQTRMRIVIGAFIVGLLLLVASLLLPHEQDWSPRQYRYHSLNLSSPAFWPDEKTIQKWAESVPDVFPDRPHGALLRTELFSDRATMWVFGNWTSEIAEPISSRLMYLESGWPFRALKWTRWSESDEAGELLTESEWSIQPFQFAANLTLYFLVSFGVLQIGVKGIRSATLIVRRYRDDDVCTRCGYDLSGADHDRCPECGS